MDILSHSLFSAVHHLPPAFRRPSSVFSFLASTP
jgi:hypothetical protein